MKKIILSLLPLLATSFAAAESTTPEAGFLTRPELRRRAEDIMLPFDYKIEKDEVVDSDSDPRQKLRRIEVKFYSQEMNGRKWGHPCVVFMPADPSVYNTPERKGRAVIVGQRSWDHLATGPWRTSFLGNYGEPIAALTGYPVMICPIPGEYDGEDGREIRLLFLDDKVGESGDPTDHPDFRQALGYLRAMDVMAAMLEIERKDLRVVMGGHSKRATSAHLAAALEPDTVAGLIYMGNESIWAGASLEPPLGSIAPIHIKDWIRAKVLYIGATNEDGYEMFSINQIQENMDGKWTVEYIPNYRHGSQSEKHFLDWRMWIAHTFENRPITQISKLAFEETDEGQLWGGREREGGTLFRCAIDSPNKIIQAKVWYVYNDDEPYWRDLMWYPEFMVPMGGGQWAGFVLGKLPDAWLVEVKDIAGGTAGYVSSLPQDITGKATERRTSHGSRSRNWEPMRR